jgi:hypothetical protein
MSSLKMAETTLSRNPIIDVRRNLQLCPEQRQYDISVNTEQPPDLLPVITRRRCMSHGRYYLIALLIITC